MIALKNKMYMVKCLSVILAISLLGNSIITKNVYSLTDTNYVNYAEALQKSLFFYDTQKCGNNVDGKNIDWRGNCHTGDLSSSIEDSNLSKEFMELNGNTIDPDNDGKLDLCGGFHDSGDGMKYGIGQSYSAWSLEWARYEYPEAFKKTNQDEHLKEIIKSFTDYLLKCSFLNDNGDMIAFCHTVGDINVDHGFWCPPELFPQNHKRPSLFATSEFPASNICAQLSAALSLYYLNFYKTDNEYAEKCLKYAKAAYDFAVKYRGVYSSSTFYDSEDEDDLSWAAIWLYNCTREKRYLDDVISDDGKGNYNGYIKKVISGASEMWENKWTNCPSNIWTGVFIKLADICNDNAQFNKIARWNLDFWSGNGESKNDQDNVSHVNTTEGGLAYLDQWGVLSYNCSAQMCSMVYSKNKIGEDYGLWAKSQMDYIAGKNPAEYSYIVGYGGQDDVKWPVHVHDRAASGKTVFIDNKNKHTLWGALVGGPNFSDSFNDSINDYTRTFVSLFYNANLVCALAGLYSLYGQDQSPIPDFSPKEKAGLEYYCESKLENDNNKKTEVSLKLCVEPCNPPRYETDVNFRYFFNISELIMHGQGIDDVFLRCDNQLMYDGLIQDNFPVHITGPFQYDKFGTYYYIFDFAENKIYGEFDLVFALGVRTLNNAQSYWSSSNDWSASGINPLMKGNINIPVYLGDNKVYGIEPSRIESPTSTATASVSTITPTATTQSTYNYSGNTTSSGNTNANSNDASKNTAPTAIPTPTATGMPTPMVTPSSALVTQPNNKKPGGDIIRNTPAPTKLPVKITLTDIKNHWAKKYIENVVEAGLMSGKGDGIFDPDQFTTRAECAKVFTKLTKTLKEEQDNKNRKFIDVDRSNPFYNYIQAAHIEGIMIGYKEGNFAPDKRIYREELTVVLSRIMTKYYTLQEIKAWKNNGEEAPKGTLKLPFTDSKKVADYAMDGVAFSVNYGIINGRPGGVFDPKGYTTRAELAAILYKIVNKYGMP